MNRFGILTETKASQLLLKGNCSKAYAEGDYKNWEGTLKHWGGDTLIVKI